MLKELKKFFVNLWKDERGIAPAPPPVDPVTTAVFVGSLVGPALFKTLFGGGASKSERFSEAVQEQFGRRPFSVQFAGFEAFRADENAPVFFSRRVFDQGGNMAGTAFFSSNNGELVQVRDRFGNITDAIPGIVRGRFVWTPESQSKENRKKRKEELEGSLELALKNELKKDDPIPDSEQSDVTRGRARCTASGLIAIPGEGEGGGHCVTPDALEACKLAGGEMINGVCVTPDIPQEEQPETTFESDVFDCPPERPVKVPDPSSPSGFRCEAEEDNVFGGALPQPRTPPVQPIPVPPRSRSRVPRDPRDPTFTVDVVDCPDGEIRVPDGLGGFVCVPAPPTITPRRPPGRSRQVPLPDVPCPEGMIKLPDGSCVERPEPPVPEEAPIPDELPPGDVPPEPRVPPRAREPRGGFPDLGLGNINVGAAGAGFGPRFAGPIVVGGSPGGTLFPAQQARVPALPGTLLQFLSELSRR